MKNSAFSSLLLLLFTCSCSVALFDGYRAAEGQPAGSPSWFADGISHSLFTASVDMYGYHASGLMVVSPLANGGHRVVMMTEFGLKMLDMEFGADGSFILHYCMEAFDRKALTDMLRKDIGMLLGPAADRQGTSVMRDRRSGETVLKVPDGGQRYFYHLNPQTGKANAVIRSNALSRKARADFYAGNSGRLDSIHLSHDNLKINIKLTRIDEIQSPSPQ